MAKKRTDYFKLLEEQISYTVKAAKQLHIVLSNFDFDIHSSAITQPRMKPNRTVISETITVVAVPRKKY